MSATNHGGRWCIVLASVFSLTGCASAPRLPPAHAGAPAFDPAVFFAAKTEGRGRLKTLFAKAQDTLVDGSGRVEGDGSIILDQFVRRGDKPATKREWHLRRIAPGRYAGTLTDADGPVSGDVYGSRLHLALPMKGGLNAEQWLDIQPGGQLAQNRMIVRKFGVAVARLQETITRKAMN